MKSLYSIVAGALSGVLVTVVVSAWCESASRLNRADCSVQEELAVVEFRVRLMEARLGGLRDEVRSLSDGVPGVVWARERRAGGKEGEGR